MSFSIIRNDITKVKADAIVNTANPHPVIGGGTDTAVYMAAGEERLLEKRKEIGDIAPGHAVETPAFDLSAEYIIHTVGPVWQGGNQGEEEILRSCYRNSLALAADLDCASVAFPLIATGSYGFPKDLALKIAMESFREFEEESEEDLEILLVVFDRESFVISDSVFRGVEAFIDGNYVEEKLDEEYGKSSLRRERNEVFHNLRPDTGNIRGSGFGGKSLAGIFGKKAKASFKSSEAAPMEDAERADVCAAPKEDAGRADVCAAPMEDAECADVCAAPMEAAEEECDILLSEPFHARQAERSLQDVMAQVGETWQQSLFRYIDEKGFTDTEVYKRANVDRKLFSKIRSNEQYQPKKITAVAFALALKLNLDEAKDFIGRAGYAFSPGSRFDLIVEYYISIKEYDSYIINATLFEYDQPLIGA